MKKFTLILVLLLSLICTACENNLRVEKGILIVKRVRLETHPGLKKVGKYNVQIESTCPKGQCIIFNTDSIYNPGDTLYIKN